jgi:hypothetical protein
VSGSFRLRAIPLLVLVVVAVASVASNATAARPRAHAAGTTCGVGSGRGLGYTYVTFLWVNKTSCKTGKSVAKHHGHGWSCKKKIIDNSPVQYDALMTCHSRGRTVQWKFTQNK